MPLVSLPARTSRQGMILLLSMTTSQNTLKGPRVHVLRFAASLVVAAYAKSTPHAACLARLASGAFCKVVRDYTYFDFHNFIKHCPSTRKNSLIFVSQAGRFFPGETAWQPDYLPPEPSKMLCRNRLCLKRLTHRTAPDNRNARNKIRQPARYL